MLILVPTPIGNLQDITLRALDALRSARVIAAEDTRAARVLLDRHHIPVPELISFFDGNEERRVPHLIARLAAGETVVLISQAGTPLVADPGFRLVREALRANILVDALPGPSAVITALAASGLPPTPFLFLGWPPRTHGKRIHFFEPYKDLPATLIFFESPQRVAPTLQAALDALGDRPAAIARELTKLHGEVLRGTISELHGKTCNVPLRGEVTVLIEGMTRRERNRDRAAETALGDGEGSPDFSS
jgi:16S rRNA (cytidine1402-2'-O)-methyltransferase